MEGGIILTTNILTITHKNFSHLYHEAIELLNLPLNLDILEVNFGELHKIDNTLFAQYDLVITSGAHLEMINKDYYELTYLVPFYPLQFTEADLVKGLVQATHFGQRIMLMYFPEENFDLVEYECMLNIEIKRIYYSDLKEAENKMVEYYKNGFNVVLGTSSVCEIAKKKNIPNILIYSRDTLKLEIIKAYQFAATKNKMLNYSKIKDVILRHAGHSIFILDQNQRIIDTNREGIEFINRKNKHEVIGEKLDDWINLEVKLKQSEPQIITRGNEQIIVEPILNSALSKTYVVAIKQFKPRGNNHSLKEHMNPKYKFENIIHHSQIMKKTILKTQQYAQSDAPLLIYGESGTGKELIAHSVHHFSNRRLNTFLPVNCSSIPENILESELFGYEEGAFTGAKKGGKPGFFEMAQNGTIFLDEISEIPLETQTKLLRVLQEKEVIRLGGKKIITLDVRIITATNKSLTHLIQQKLFREDLYYRINVLQIHVPPVRQRLEDIPKILTHLLIKYGLDEQQANYLINIAHKHLSDYSWPGNVREIENFAQRFCALMSVSNTTFDLVKLFNDILQEFIQQDSHIEQSYFQNTIDESPIVDEKQKILRVLHETNGNKNQAAEILGISRTTLWRKIKQFNI